MNIFSCAAPLNIELESTKVQTLGELGMHGSAN